MRSQWNSGRANRQTWTTVIAFLPLGDNFYLSLGNFLDYLWGETFAQHLVKLVVRLLENISKQFFGIWSTHYLTYDYYYITYHNFTPVVL